ncbi:MAG: DUF4188 domain-containing protein [Xanthobacteraceae bacterium]
MRKVIAQRMTARIDGDFVVFLIGMRVNRPLKFWKWVPVAAQMPRMLVELARQPELGLLHARTHFGLPNIMVVQYWRSFEHLARYAGDAGAAHLPAWRAFNRTVGSNGDVGIWHETYLVKAGAHESVYNNMPPFGLGAAGRLEPAQGSLASARSRLGLAQDGLTP